MYQLFAFTWERDFSIHSTPHHEVCWEYVLHMAMLILEHLHECLVASVLNSLYQSNM